MSESFSKPTFNNQKGGYKLRSSNSISFNGNFLEFQVGVNNNIQFMTAKFLVDDSTITTKVHESHSEIIKNLNKDDKVSIYNAVFSLSQRTSKNTGKTYFSLDVYLNKNTTILVHDKSSSSISFLASFIRRGSKQSPLNEIVLLATWEINKSKFDKEEGRYKNESSSLVTIIDVSQDAVISRINPGDTVFILNATLKSEERTTQSGEVFHSHVICIGPQAIITVISRQQQKKNLDENNKNSSDPALLDLEGDSVEGFSFENE